MAKSAEAALSERGRRLIAVAPDASLREAIGIMNEEGIGAILVRDGDDFVGIWTERDLLRVAADHEFDPGRAMISDHMTRDVISAGHDEPLHQLKDKFLGLRLRHLLIERDGEVIGIISAGDVMRASLNAQAEDLASLNRMVSWEYYDNWRWRPAKKR